MLSKISIKSAKVLKTRMHQQNVLDPSIIQLLYKKVLKFSMKSAKTANSQDLNKKCLSSIIHHRTTSTQNVPKSPQITQDCLQNRTIRAGTSWYWVNIG